MNAIIDAATALYTNDLIDEYDFLSVYESTRRKSPEFQYLEYVEKVEMQLENMTNNESKALRITRVKSLDLTWQIFLF